MLRTQNPEFRFQYEESGMWEVPQCADSGGPLAERSLQRIENPKSEVPNSKRAPIEGFGFRISNFFPSVSPW